MHMNLATRGAIALATLAPLVRSQGLVITHQGGTNDYALGRTLSSAGDMSGDGVEDYAVVSFGSNLGSSTSGLGRVRVHSGADHSLMYVFTGQYSGEQFGKAIAPVGDVDGDGFDDLLIGSEGGNRVVLVSGYLGDTLLSWSQLPNVSGLGAAVARVGDVNGDGRTDMAASAPNSSFGRVYIFSGLDGSILRTWTGSHSSEALGRTMTAGADFDGDGIGDLAAYGSSSASLPARVLLLSSATGAVWRTIPSPTPSIGFGDSLCIVPDVDGDQREDLAIGAPNDATSGAGAGAVRIYSGQTGLLVRTLTGTPGAGFGRALSTLADVDGDGVRDLLVGALGNSNVKGYTAIHSGANGSQLLRVKSWGDHWPKAVAGLGDLDFDGHPEFLISSDQQALAMVLTTGTAAGSRYCLAKTDSAGCAPSISATGTPSLSGPDDFVVHASGVQNQRYGLLIWGRTPAQTAFAGGTLCVSSGFRSPVQFAGGSTTGTNCSGSFSFHFTTALALSKGIDPGEFLHAQYWYRAPGSLPPNNAGLSDAWRWMVSL